uniref:DUF1036 domain-containing protein n=1 Tax=Aquisalinus luteolus TaxID=1566827 RepID=A0A8J3A5M5_9PROT|nr:hypothetical protein GCM10011355_07790 [Aquisalinus luteolus]
MEDFIANSCIKSEGDIINIAKNTAEEVGSFAQAAATSMHSCGVFALMEAVDPDRLSVTAGEIAAKGCFETLLAQADRLGYQTVTIGGTGGAGFLIGADGENGFAFDTKGRYAPSTYHNLGFKIGLTAGGGAALTVGFYKKTNQPGPDGFGGDGHGAALGVAAYGGSGLGVWYGYDGSFAGFNAVVTAGGKLDVVYVRNTTQIISLGTVPASSGETWQAPQPAPAPSSGPSSGPSSTPPAYRPGIPAPPPPAAEFDDPNLAAAYAIGQGIATIMETRANQSRVKVCNKTDVDEVNFAHIQSMPSASGYGYEWVATGWYQAKRKRCETVRLPTNKDGSAYVGQAFFVFYGQRDGVDTFWGNEGNPSFCVDLESRFTFPGADRMACNGPSLAQIGGFPRVISLGTNQINVTD